MSLWRARVILRQLNSNINSLADPLQERVGKYAVSKTFKPEVHVQAQKLTLHLVYLEAENVITCSSSCDDSCANVFSVCESQSYVFSASFRKA